VNKDTGLRNAAADPFMQESTEGHLIIVEKKDGDSCIEFTTNLKDEHNLAWS